MSASPAIERSAIPKDSGIDRKALAGVLLQIARDLKPELGAEQNTAETGDLRLEQLRTLLVGHEIEVLARLQSVIEDPEKLAAAVGRVLPTAIAEASADARLGQVLVPALEKATERSIAKNPRTLVDILYPLIVPTIGKSIRETIAATFQSVNQTLKFSLTWRGLKWRWEAWRSGTSFAAAVLRHTLVYQVEHVFLIHRHTGLLIAHVAAEDAASQDPQLISSMLMAIQDFVKDSFSGAGQGVDTLMLGDLRLWCEAGPFAMLVAVIRGDPPEEFHDTLRQALTRMHAERHAALESFDGDGSSFADIEAELRQCLIGQQQARPAPARFGRLIFMAWLVVMLGIAGAFGWRWWESGRLWQSYVEQLRAEPGIVVTDVSERDGKLTVAGLRDPLAIDPQALMRQMGINPDTVVSRWERYEAMQPQFVAQRLKSALEPPPSVTLAVEGDRTVAQGKAPTDWLARARSAAKALPAGAPSFDVSAVQDTDETGTRLWNGYISRLGAEPGIVITENGRRDGKFFVGGLRDPLSADPAALLGQAGVDPAEVTSRWTPYQSLEPQFVLKRLEVSLAPPASVALSIADGHIVANGSAPSHWLDEARMAARLLPPGAPAFDLSGVKDAGAADTELWNGYLGRLRAEPGIVVTEAGERDGGFFVTGLRDPLASDPQALLAVAGIDPARVTARFQPYQALDATFVIERLRDSLTPPPGVTLAIEGGGIVARGAAPADWLARAREAARTLPAGAPEFDLAAVSDSDAAGASLWAGYIARLSAQPGIVITGQGKRDGKFFITGLRDPLAADPLALLAASGLDRAQVTARFQPYQALDVAFVIERLRDSLTPPAGVTLAIEGDRIVARGVAPTDWLARAREAARTLPAGAPQFDLAAVSDSDAAGASLWAGYIARLSAQPGIVITGQGKRDGKFFIAGLRDPLAADPAALLAVAEIEPGQVSAQWTPYQSLHPLFVLKRLEASLDPPSSVTLTLMGDRIAAKGSASSAWLERARLAARDLPPGAPGFDLSGVRDTDEADASRWGGYLDRLGAEPGIVVTASSQRDGKFYVTGLRDPLAADPQALLADAGIDPVRVVARWAPYQALDAEFVLTRLKASLDLPPTVTLTVEGQQIVARGSASPRWLERARLAGRMLPTGGPTLDLHEVHDLFDGAIGSLRDAIEERVVHFDVGGSLPATGQDEMLDAQAADIKKVAELSSTMGVTTRVTLIGHANSVGQGTSNLSLSVARAEAVRALLKKRGVNPDNLAVRGAGAMEPLQEETSDAAKSANRRVSLSLGVE